MFENDLSLLTNSIKTAEISTILKIGFKRSNSLDNLTGFQNHFLIYLTLTEPMYLKFYFLTI